jgi:hypothetical protein
MTEDMFYFSEINPGPIVHQDEESLEILKEQWDQMEKQILQKEENEEEPFWKRFIK